MSKEKTIIERVNYAVKEYYKALGKEEQYTADDDRGRFQSFCEDNGIEDEEGLKDDLEGEPEDSNLVDIDANFPIPQNQQIDNDQQRQQYIFNILKECYKDPDKLWDHLKTGLPAFNKQLFDIDDKEIETTKEKYKIQCPSIYYQNLKLDVSLLQSYVHQEIYMFVYRLYTIIMIVHIFFDSIKYR